MTASQENFHNHKTAGKLVSIGFLTYNRAALLPRALDSLLAQTYTNFELIISDNCSQDDTQKICEEYARKDSRIHYIRQKHNIGSIKNFVFVALQARGDYFMWAADDDWWDPRFIEVFKNALDERPDYGLAMSSYSMHYDDGEFLSETKFDGENDITNLGYGKMLEIMMKRAPLDKFTYGLFRTGIVRKLVSRPFPTCIAPDRVYMCEVAASTHFYSHPETLYYTTLYRQSLIVRRGGKDEAAAYLDRFHYTKYVLTAICRVLTSPIVPLRRKVTILPVAAAKLFWFGKGRILHELSPVIYKAIFDLRARKGVYF